MPYHWTWVKDASYIGKHHVGEHIYDRKCHVMSCHCRNAFAGFDVSYAVVCVVL
jgi:hypothetical protein